jgi:hypothetical protein
MGHKEFRSLLITDWHGPQKEVPSSQRERSERTADPVQKQTCFLFGTTPELYILFSKEFYVVESQSDSRQEPLGPLLPLPTRV